MHQYGRLPVLQCVNCVLKTHFDWIVLLAFITCPFLMSGNSYIKEQVSHSSSIYQIRWVILGILYISTSADSLLTLSSDSFFFKWSKRRSRSSLFRWDILCFPKAAAQRRTSSGPQRRYISFRMSW